MLLANRFSTAKIITEMELKSKSDERPLPFFVYGTLLPDQLNARLWHGDDVVVEAASFANGRLYDMGGYPMLVEDGGAPIKGCVIIVPETRYTAVLARLDALEGYNPAQPGAPGYRRLARSVNMADGSPLTAWIYVGQEALVNGSAPIQNGDWVAYVAADCDRQQAWPKNLNIVYGLHRPPTDE